MYILDICVGAVARHRIHSVCPINQRVTLDIVTIVVKIHSKTTAKPLPVFL